MQSLDAVIRHVRQQRRLLGMSQAALAKDAGTSQSFIAKLEQGRLNPSYTAVRDVLNALEHHARRDEPTAAQLMRHKPVCVGSQDRVEQALQIMKKGGYSQLPVVDDGRPVGSFSEGLLLDCLERGEELDDLKGLPVQRVMRGTYPIVDRDVRRHVIVEHLRAQGLVLVVDGAQLVGVITKSDLW